MGDTNKQTKAISLDPKVIEYVNTLVDKNQTTFTKEVEKSINVRKANDEKKVYTYSKELEDIPLTSARGKSQGWWTRECALLLAKILELLEQQELNRNEAGK